MQLPPIDRLDKIESSNDKIDEYIKEIRFKYNWFLTLTDLPETDLTSFFMKKNNRINAFGKARDFGDTVYNLVKEVADENNYLRYLLV